TGSRAARRASRADHRPVGARQHRGGFCRRGDGLSDQAVPAGTRAGPRPSLAATPSGGFGPRDMDERGGARPPSSVERDGNAAFVESLAAFSRGCGVFVGLVGLVVLTGWGFHLEPLKSGLPGHVATNPATALILLLLAGGLRIQHRAWRQSSA